MAEEVTYPRCFPIIVGSAPDKVKTFSSDDVAMLLEAFHRLTHIDPLQVVGSLREAWWGQPMTLAERAHNEQGHRNDLQRQDHAKAG